MNKRIKNAIEIASKIYNVDCNQVLKLTEKIELRSIRELRFSPYLNMLNMLTYPESWYIKSEMSSTNTGVYSIDRTKKVKLPKFQIIYGSEFGVFGIPICLYKEYGFTSKYKFYRILSYSYLNQAIIFISYNIRKNNLNVTNIV